jgi:hypothetical protein
VEIHELIEQQGTFQRAVQERSGQARTESFNWYQAEKVLLGSAKAGGRAVWR